MAADLHLHVTRLLGGEQDVDMQDFHTFFASTLGSPYFDLERARTAQQDGSWEKAYHKFAALPDFWIGEVSWLKAAVFDDPAAFVPDPVQAVAAAVGDELPLIDDALIEKIMAAHAAPNQTAYAVTDRRVALKAWLEQYRGWYLFEVSW